MSAMPVPIDQAETLELTETSQASLSQTFSDLAPKRSSCPDYWLLAVVMLAIGFGVVMVYSASNVYAKNLFDDPSRFFRMQALYAVMGVALMVGTAMINYHWWRRLALPLLILSIFLLAILLVPGIGVTVNRATRWLNFGPFRFQPSELAKLALIVYLAASLVRKGQKIRNFKVGFLPHLVVCLTIVALCMRQPDLGTSALMIFVMLWVLYVGGTRLAYLIMVFLLGLPVVYLAITTSLTRTARLVAFMNPWEHRQGIGYHIINSLIGLGSGGATGIGLGESKQKLLYLPEAHTDFILSIIGEELGFVGVVGVVVIFAVLLWRGAKIALAARDDFGAYLAFAITFMLGMQAAVNMGVVTAVLPITGLTLPFISYGGSSMLISMVMVGILLNISMGQEDTWEMRRANHKRKQGFMRVMKRNKGRLAGQA